MIPVAASSGVYGAGGAAATSKASKAGALTLTRDVATEYSTTTSAPTPYTGLVATKILDHAIEAAEEATTPPSEHRPAAWIRPPIACAVRPPISQPPWPPALRRLLLHARSALMVDGGYTAI
jgi:hypothetical protein